MKTDGFAIKGFNFTVKRYCQTLDLKEDESLIREYCRLHSKEYQDSAIRDEIRSVGILEMEIYIKDNRLFMIVETRPDFEWDKAMAELAALPHQSTWEALVGRYQKCEPYATSSQKWTLMDRIFYLYDE